MDHAGLVDCQSCHAQPAGHIPAPGQCSNCHTSTVSWREVRMDHAGLTDCQSCHTPPTGHYPGQCSNCHTSTSDWGDVSMDHAGLTDCQGCHTPPAGHYPGQCSQCHDTSGWGRDGLNHTFPINHKGAGGDCSSCHPGYNYGTYTCYTCHDRDETAEDHREVGGFGDDCARCHANGTLSEAIVASQEDTQPIVVQRVGPNPTGIEDRVPSPRTSDRPYQAKVAPAWQAAMLLSTPTPATNARRRRRQSEQDDDAIPTALDGDPSPTRTAFHRPQAAHGDPKSPV